MTKIQRYKVGFFSDEWGMSSITPCLIPDDIGFAVKFEDYCKLEAENERLKHNLTTAERDAALNEARDFESDVDTVTQHNVELQLETIALKSALNVARYALERLSPSLNNQHPNVIFVFEALAKINEVLK